MYAQSERRQAPARRKAGLVECRLAMGASSRGLGLSVATSGQRGRSERCGLRQMAAAQDGGAGGGRWARRRCSWGLCIPRLAG